MFLLRTSRLGKMGDFDFHFLEMLILIESEDPQSFDLGFSSMDATKNAHFFNNDKISGSRRIVRVQIKNGGFRVITFRRLPAPAALAAMPRALTVGVFAWAGANFASTPSG